MHVVIVKNIVGLLNVKQLLHFTILAMVSMVVGGVAEWVERWSRPANFSYPTPDC